MRHRRFWVRFVMAGCLASGAAVAQPYVFGHATLPVAASPAAVASGDFNGDGAPDFAVANPGAGTVSVILATPAGSYAVKTDYPVAGAESVVTGDFNNDGKPDLAIATGSGIAVMLGRGDGTFEAPVATGVASTALAVGDFNHDGNLDLAVASASSGLLLGNGDGTFTVAVSFLGPYSNVNVADFNGDGNLDVAMTGPTGGKVFLGNGAGALTAAGSFYVTIGAAAVADFNGDGKPDVAGYWSGCSTRGPCHYWYALYLGVGDGTFTGGTTVAAAGAPMALIAADFNQDGKQDLLAAPGGLMLGLGNGALSNPAPIPAAAATSGAVVGDFNGDGQLDLGALDKGGTLALTVGNKGVFAGPLTAGAAATMGSAAVLADLNGDGKLDQVTAAGSTVVVQLGNGDGTFGAPIVSSGAPGGSSVAVGDFNGDGRMDVAVAGPGSSTLTYSVMLGNGDGTFQAPKSGYSNRYPLLMAAADLNGDGKLDLLIASQNGGDGVDVHLGNGDGTFGSGVTYATCFAGGFVTGDFNGDGKTDAAVACNDLGPGGIDVLIGKGDGTFQPEVTYNAADYYHWTLAMGDFNGDGRPDLAEGGFGGISVFLGNGNGTFQAAIGPFGGVTTQWMTSADFNGDGKWDLAAIVYPAGRTPLELFTSQGDGTFVASQMSGTPAAGLAAGDLNGDGVPDLFALSLGTGSSETFSYLNLPVAMFAPGGLRFPNQIVNTASGTLTVSIANASSTKLELGTPAVGAPFAMVSNDCPATLATGISCAIGVQFQPVSVGLLSGVLSMPTNSIAGAANLPLTGIGTAAGAKVGLSATSLTFPGKLVGTSSGAQTIVVTSAGVGAVTFAGIQTTGDFLQTNNCPMVLAPLATCTISVTFKPRAPGSRTGSLTLTDNAPGGSQMVPLSGTGTAPVATLNPASLKFGLDIVQNDTAPKLVTLTNTGTAALNNIFISITGADPGDFGQKNSCPASLAVGQSCKIYVVFAPLTINLRTASLTISDSALNSPQKVPLSGTGTDIAVVPGTTGFGGVSVGATSKPATIYVVNAGGQTVTINGISLSGADAGDFHISTSACGATLGAGLKCAVTVTFQPTAKGTRTAVLAVSDTGGGSPQLGHLQGVGQ